MPESSSSDDSSDEEEDDIPTRENINYSIAKDGFKLLEQYKAKKYLRVLDNIDGNYPVITLFSLW